MTVTKERALEQYRRQVKLGEGTYGVVFKAIDTETNETVALKKIRIDDDDEGIPSTAIREVALLKDLTHENIVSLLHVIFHRTQLYLVFEYLPYDLKKYMIANQNRLSIYTIQSFSYQLLKGIDYCHSQRVLHRDLKPQNILVSNDGIIKLADFGLARAFCLPNRTWTHEVITLWYRPPEILLGTQTYTVTADMWSLGTIIIEMMNGKPLFQGDSEICQLMHIFKQIGTPNENVWKGVSKLKDYQPNFPKWKSKTWNELVPEPYCNDLGRNLISLLVSLDPSKRITAKQALKHPYFDDYLKQTTMTNSNKNSNNSNMSKNKKTDEKTDDNNNNNNNEVNSRIESWRQEMTNTNSNDNDTDMKSVNNNNNNENSNTINNNNNSNKNKSGIEKENVDNSETRNENVKMDKNGIKNNETSNNNGNSKSHVLQPNTSLNRQ